MSTTTAVRIPQVVIPDPFAPVIADIKPWRITATGWDSVTNADVHTVTVVSTTREGAQRLSRTALLNMRSIDQQARVSMVPVS